MIPVLYPAAETSFTNNGLGGLPDAISCVVTEQRNTQGGYYLEMDYPIDGLHYADIAPERIIYAAPAMGKTPQPFRISRITRPINGIVHIEAPHVSAELQKIVTYGRMRAYTVWGLWSDFKGVATNIGQACPFTISSNFNLTEAINFWFDEPITMASLLMGMEGSMLDKIGGEIEFDKWNVVYNTQRGVDSGLEIRYGANMSDLEAETDATELVTAVVPFWKGTVNNTDTVVVGDMCSASNASAYSYVRCVPLDVSQQFDLEQDEQPTKAEVTEKGTDFINSTSRKLLQTSIKVKYEPTTNGIGERLINLCDTVRVVYPDLNVSSISKVVETRFNVLTEQYDELTIGSIRNNIVDTIAGLISGGAITGGGGSSGGGGGSSAVTSVNGKTGAVVLNATDVGAMPSTYTAPVTSVNGMTGDVVVSGGGGGAVDSVNGKTGVVVLTASDVGAVAAESGKGLSTNDFTTAEKNKLSGIAAGAEVNVQADWNQTDSTADDYIKNKPTGDILPPFTASDALKRLCVNANGTDVEWSADADADAVLYTAQSKTVNEKLQARRNIGMLSPFVTFLYLSNQLTSVDGVLTGNQIVEKYGVSSTANVCGMFALDINNYKAYYLESFDYDHGTVVFRRKESDGFKLLTISGDSTTVTESTEPFDVINAFYYLDGTTVKSVETNLAVTAQDISRSTTAKGVSPIVYQYDSAAYATNEFHYYQWHSGGMVFRTLDGKKQIFVPWGSSTATITQSPGYSANIVFYLDGTTVKYTGTNTAVTGNDVAAMTLANGNMPVIRQLDSNAVDHYYHLRVAHSGGMEFRLLDGTKKLLMTYNSSTATITQEYYAVTLNSDGTVNTFDSALTYSAAAASVINGNPKKLIVTWGNSIFTAEANEKLSGANGDVKFITDVEHDGIQRHMIFTLTSANALQTTLIETYARVPITVWEVSDVTQGLIALNTNISSSLAWQLTGLNLSPFKRIKVYAKAGRKTGAMAADSSIVPAAIIEMLLDDRAKETVSQNVFIGSVVVQNPNDANRLGMLTCAVSGDKTKFAVTRATSLYGTAATSNTDCYQYVFKIEGYYD